MTPVERTAYEQLQQRVQTLACRIQLLLSDCRDGDQRLIADESRVRHDILAGVHDLCEWTGQRGFREPDQMAPGGPGRGHVGWRRETLDELAPGESFLVHPLTDRPSKEAQRWHKAAIYTEFRVRCRLLDAQTMEITRLP